MLNNQMQLSFSSISENEALARMCIAAFAAQCDPTVEELSDIRTAVSEAVTNSIIHGYKCDPTKTVFLEASIVEKTITVTIKDKGCGISDVSEAMKPFFTTVNTGERSGMGFAVMEAFMDSLTVKSVPMVGTSVTMVKVISSFTEEPLCE